MKIVAKSDSKGTLEALINEIRKIYTEKSVSKVIHSGVGEVSESDVMLASAGEAIIVGFNITVPSRIEKLAEKEGVEILTYEVIYHLTEKIIEILEGRESVEETGETLGQFIIKAIFASNKKMAVIGGDVTEGLMRKLARFRQSRKTKNKDGEEVDELLGEGRVESVQLGQKAATEVKADT